MVFDSGVIISDGFSDNEGISQKHSSLRYIHLSEPPIVSIVKLLAKYSHYTVVEVDIKEAYQVVPIHPHNQHLLGV